MSDAIFSFKDPIYEFRIQVVITEDMDRWDKKYPCVEGAASSSDALFVRPSSDKKFAIIVIKPTSPLDDLQHEIGHAARCVMKHIGFSIDFCNDEPLAYYEGYLTKMVHKGIKKLNSLDKKKKRA